MAFNDPAYHLHIEENKLLSQMKTACNNKAPSVSGWTEELIVTIAQSAQGADHPFQAKKRLSTAQAKLKKLLQILRSPNERPFSRLHCRWAMLGFTHVDAELTALAVQALVR
jgi:hypothetical protein